MNGWPVNDTQLITAMVLGLILVVLIVTAFQRTGVTRKEFSRLQNDVKQLSDNVKGLEAVEQRRFLKELKASKEDDKILIAAPESPVSESPVSHRANA